MSNYNLAIDWALIYCCEEISAKESLANDLVVHGKPKQALFVAESIPKIFKVRVELYSKEQEPDARGYPVPKKVIFVNVQTLNPTEDAIVEAMSSYLEEFNIGGYTMPYQEIDKELLF